ncbi:MAG TPA: bifunctional diaminohydroxyphosphoribosylaminopyrimidine deaminase/5-amino-6-(5-phosphoribosylamino)uracil reductase RibD [Pirellulales bacterium]|nr:bifunctional diaminohydroxyphosphoribosylaminopyrimidine deaminase/5-amino-6-(5-phosphoribosylamino)uracil reductase RibD [Pirellulales bacterium]
MTIEQSEFDASHMARAIELAARGEGFVEPNPMVGCTIVADGETVGEGFHRRFGGPHAEIEALASAGPRARHATVYVTLEPCCHQGKTPPCTQALICAGVRRVVVAQRDPFVKVAGQGIAELKQAGIEVELGLLEAEAQELNAPYLKLVGARRPWIIAKWAMTLDGKLATHAGDSRWISGKASRPIVHQLRGRVDGVMIARGTASADDPLLMARPPGPRTAARIVLDSNASLSPTSQLVRTARDGPVIVAVSQQSPTSDRQRLIDPGCEVLICAGSSHGERLDWLLEELGRRQMTNILVEGGSQLLGSLLDSGQIDEVHVFIAPKLVGGHAAPSPISGSGLDLMKNALELTSPQIEQCGADAHVHGRVKRNSA